MKCPNQGICPSKGIRMESRHVGSPNTKVGWRQSGDHRPSWGFPSRAGVSLLGHHSRWPGGRHRHQEPPETHCCEPSKPSHAPSLTWRLRSRLLWPMERSGANVNGEPPEALGGEQCSRRSSPHPAAMTAISPWWLSACGGERWHFVAGGPQATDRIPCEDAEG